MTYKNISLPLRCFTALGLCSLVGSAVACRPTSSKIKSLTSAADDAANPNRKKYFFSFAQVINDSFMDQEARADNLHVLNFAKDANGGGYTANPAFAEGYLPVDDKSGDKILAEYGRIEASIAPGDMYLQMSAGHGYQGGGSAGGVVAGVSHQQVKDQAFAMLDKGAKEVVIFMMACYSGGLVEAFQNDPRLANYPDRTIFAMGSSQTNQESQSLSNVAPDPALGGAPGSGGTAFGNALWRALAGEADHADAGGNDDGIVSLGEIVRFTTDKTKGQADQTPVVLAGHYQDDLAIVCIPGHRKAAANPLCRAATANSPSSVTTIPTASSNASVNITPGTPGYDKAADLAAHDGVCAPFWDTSDAAPCGAPGPKGQQHYCSAKNLGCWLP